MNPAFRRVRKLSTWRRIAMATWHAPNDPTCYGTLALDAGPALAYLERIRTQTGVKATMTHLVGRALALAIKDTPDINGRIVGNSLLLRSTVDVSYQVALDDGRELSGAKIDRVDEKDVHEVARELGEKAARIREKRDPQFQRSKKVLDRMPQFLLRPTLRLTSYLTNDRGWNLAPLNLPADPFGSAMVTSVGMFGIDVGFAPIVPLAGTPLIVLVGETQQRAVVEAGAVVARPVVQLGVSFDHRFIDGFHAGRMARVIRAYFAAPDAHEVQRLLAP